MLGTTMKRWPLGVTAALALTGAAQAQTAVGDWHGALSTAGGDLRLVVRIKPGASGLEGVMISPDQGAAEVALGDIKLDGSTLAFTAPRIRGTYQGRWDAAAKDWAGTWTQGPTALPLTLLAGDLPKGPVIAGLDGDWAGEVTTDTGKIRMILHVRTGAYGTTASLDSPDQLIAGLPAVLTRDKGKVGFTIKATGLSYSGDLAADGRSIVGSTRQADRTRALVLTHREPAAAGTRVRPQTPVPPFPYAATEVAFDSAPGVKLAGTLTLPPGDGPFPAVIMISGSGPQDRDETLLGHKPFAVIADALTRRGVAVLRYDDRGVGKSTGDFTAAGIDDFALDTTAALDWLSKQSRIDTRRIGLLGHSEGAVVAPMVAAKDSRAAFLVLIGAPAVPLTDVLRAQRAALAPFMGLSAQRLAANEVVFDRVVAAMQGAATTKEAQDRAAAIFRKDGAAMGMTNENMVQSAAAGISTPEIRSLLSYDPRPALAKVTVPVLAVIGSKDLQVLANQNLPALRTALSANRDVTAVELPGLNHLLQTAPTGAAGEYADIAETVAPSALKLIGDWVVARGMR